MDNYSGLCIGGPMDGEYTSNDRDQFYVCIPKSGSPDMHGLPSPPFIACESSIYYHAILGSCGFWLTEENKDYTVLMHILQETYAERTMQRKSDERELRQLPMRCNMKYQPDEI